MSFEQPGTKLSLEAAADLSALQYTFVKLDSSGKAAAVSAATDIPVGVLQNKPIQGQVAEIMVDGITKLVAGVTMDEGNLVGVGAAGKSTVVVAGTDTTKYVLGQALEPAAANEIFAALINCAAPHRAA